MGHTLHVRGKQQRYRPSVLCLVCQAIDKTKGQFQKMKLTLASNNLDAFPKMLTDFASHSAATLASEYLGGSASHHSPSADNTNRKNASDFDASKSLAHYHRARH